MVKKYLNYQPKAHRKVSAYIYHTGRKFLDYQRCICKYHGLIQRLWRKVMYSDLFEIMRKDNFDFRKRIFTAVSESDVETADNSKKKKKSSTQ